MALEPVQIPHAERVRQVREKIKTHELLIEKWTHRRDEGDGVPDHETLTKWIDQETSALRIQESNLASLTRSDATES